MSDNISFKPSQTIKSSKIATPIRVPTNIVTGFLGSGKTTLIQSILANKPENENWVILINEFGEVGLDEQIIEASGDQNTNQKGSGTLNEQKEGQIQISQISGGCLCCANGVPFQVALVQLISKQDKTPDRLIIEPTGLGHPKQIISQLSAQPFIEMQSVLTVVDPRKTQDSRYSEHEIFNSQIEVADLLICNKQDLYQPDDFKNFEIWLTAKRHQPKVLLQTINGKVDQKYLSEFTNKTRQQTKPKINLLLNQNATTSGMIDFMEYPAEQEQQQAKVESIQEFEQNEDGFYGLGLIFDDSFVFDESKLINELMSFDVVRLKGMMKTKVNALMINSMDDVFTENKVEQTPQDSRIQLISFNVIDKNEIKQALLNALV